MLALMPAPVLDTDTTSAAPSAADASEPTGFDAAAFAAKNDAKPLQDYSSAWQPQEPPPAPQSGDAPGTDAPGTDTPKEPAPEPSDRAEASAREFIELYDMAQSYAFHYYSLGLKPETFELEKFPKERAIHHLAKGMEKMGSPEVPWWLGLLIALAPPAFINWKTAQEHREKTAEAEEKKGEKNRATHKRGEALDPDAVFGADGIRLDTRPPAPETVRTAAPAAAAPARPPQTKAPLPLCQECGVNQVGRKGKKYCSQSCAGKATTRKRRELTPAQP